MIIVKGILALVIFLIIPTLLGFLITRFLKEYESNVFLAIVLGYLSEFAICQILAIPMIYAKATLTTMLIVYLIITSFLSLVSIILNIKNVKEIIDENIKNIKKFPIGLAIITIVFIGIQIYGFIGYAHIDDDDAFYVGTATVAVQTDTLYRYSATTGEEQSGDHLSSRYRLAPFPVFTALVSKILEIHPAIIAHTVLPVIFIPIVYIIYGLIANELFKSDKKNVFLFLIIMSILHIWGNYSIRTNFTFLLFRIWQGKSVLANMIIPAIILFFIMAEKYEFKFVNCLILLITILAGNFTTTMGIGLTPIVLMLLSVTYEIFKINYKDIKNNNYKLHFKNVCKCFICCIPSIIYGIAYFVK